MPKYSIDEKTGKKEASCGLLWYSWRPSTAYWKWTLKLQNDDLVCVVSESYADFIMVEIWLLQ